MAHRTATVHTVHATTNARVDQIVVSRMTGVLIAAILMIVVPLQVTAARLQGTVVLMIVVPLQVTAARLQGTVVLMTGAQVRIVRVGLIVVSRMTGVLIAAILMTAVPLQVTAVPLRVTAVRRRVIVVLMIVVPIVVVLMTVVRLRAIGAQRRVIVVLMTGAQVRIVRVGLIVVSRMIGVLIAVILMIVVPLQVTAVRLRGTVVSMIVVPLRAIGAPSRLTEAPIREDQTVAKAEMIADLATTVPHTAALRHRELAEPAMLARPVTVARHHSGRRAHSIPARGSKSHPKAPRSAAKVTGPRRRSPRAKPHTSATHDQHLKVHQWSALLCQTRKHSAKKASACKRCSPKPESVLAAYASTSSTRVASKSTAPR
ncbi:hypothetical protein [Hoyosella rhizosphaerae]|uniref:hypothetical protein n=1 Tax=Hoyosella rhizosphaerae TaxID=1755582 RepID=UPI001F11EFA0|nr:hypothetical protein [Hoyosella rhizosphaerae]